MKWYQFGLIFVVIAFSFFMMSQMQLVMRMKEETERRTEYDCLTAAVNAAAEAVFTGAENRVTTAGLLQAEEVFFQTLSILHDGLTDEAGKEVIRKRVPCLVIFDESGYYQYGNTEKGDYAWSVCVPYQEGEILEEFYTEVEEKLWKYQSRYNAKRTTYRMKAAVKGVWEEGLSKGCVFAIYVPDAAESDLAKTKITFLYAASSRKKEAYLVTEDNYCHLPSCECIRNQTVTAWYATQKKSAEDGAIPCPMCMQ